MSEKPKIGADRFASNPGNRGKGRPKGVPNKLSRTVKQSIEAAFDIIGGAEYLARQAEENPAAFMTLLGKILPTQIDANITGKIEPVIFQRIDASGPPIADD